MDRGHEFARVSLMVAAIAVWRARSIGAFWVRDGFVSSSRRADSRRAAARRVRASRAWPTTPGRARLRISFSIVVTGSGRGRGGFFERRRWVGGRDAVIGVPATLLDPNPSLVDGARPGTGAALGREGGSSKPEIGPINNFRRLFGTYD